MATAVQTVERENYLNSNYSIKSWLLTTDHKRIALLYLMSITAMFWLGGFFAMMIRLELLTPAGDLVSSDTYNKLFTMHGITMVFFFLIPSVPAVIGNFVIPLMVGAKDLAFPRLNLASWYIYMIGACLALYGLPAAASTPAGPSTRRSAPRIRTPTWSRWRWASSSRDSPPSSPA